MTRTNPHIATLVANRALETPAQVAAFDAALAAVDRDGAQAVLDALHLVLTDDTQDHEVMWGVVHLIEAQGIDAQLDSMFRVLPALADQAPEWVMALHYRLINNTETRARYPVRLAGASAATIASARSILETIGEDSEPSLRDGARAILAAIDA